MFKFLLFAAATLSAEQTLSIIKPDAVQQSYVEEIDAYLKCIISYKERCR